MSDLECTSDDMWPTLLRDVLEYVTLLTNLELEGSAPSVPTLTRKEIIERDTTRKESRTAAIARAPLLTAVTAAATAAAAAATQHRGKMTRTRGHEATQPAAPP